LPNVELVPAALEQQPIIANLLELYIYDFSEFFDLELGADGTFGYPDLPLYWSAPGRFPFLVEVDRKWAGFVLVKQEPAIPTGEAIYDIAEFFILRPYRRRGIGAQVAPDVWRSFPGPWTVRVMQRNRAARPFWERAITSFTGQAVEPSSFEHDGQSWTRFSLVSPRHLANSPRCPVIPSERLKGVEGPAS
jgi:predicted acetyltransferase